MSSTKQKLSIVAGLLAAAIGTTAGAAIIDDFSSDTSTKYNVVLAYNPALSTYARSGNQFAPLGGSNSTNFFLRNDGYVFGLGDTVSTDLTTGNSTAGLIFCQSLTSGGPNDKGYMLNVNQSNTMLFNGATPLADFDNAFTYGPATIAVTRTGATTLDYTVAYYKTGGSLAQFTGSDTLSAGTYYFGMLIYVPTGVPDTEARWDNLASTPVPEPASLALLGLVAGAGLYRRRR